MKISHKLYCEVSRKYKPQYTYHEKREWNNRGNRMNFPRAYIPIEVKKAIKTIPEDMFTSSRYDDEIKKNTVINFNDFNNWKKADLKELLIESDPLKLVKRPDAFIFKQSSRFEYGIIQASLLTKTKVMDTKIPLNESNTLPEYLRQILERIITKANFWITDEHKFPRRFDVNKPIYKYKPEYGISMKNNIRYLLKDLFELSEHISNCKGKRIFNKDHYLETFYYWNSRRINFEESRDFVISGLEPLIPFEENIINWDPQSYLCTMGPIDPCIDLEMTNYYSLSSCDGWKSAHVSHKYPHLITVNFDLPNIHTDFLEPEARQITQSQKISIGIMNCFAQSVATARRLFGDAIVDKGDLPHPICLHAICFDGVQFDFISYQLNSTNFSDSKCANLVWFDESNKFFNKHLRRKGMLRNIRFENLNVDVFKKFLQYFQYGLK